MRQFKKGIDPRRNTKGRPAGTRNKSTEGLRATIQLFVEKNWDQIQDTFDKMKPVEKLNFIVSLLRYVLPPPVTPETLNESQLSQLHEYLLIKYSKSENEKQP